LEEVDEARAMRIGFPGGWEELTAEALLLRRAPIREGEEDRIEKIRVDVVRLPADVEVSRFILRRDKAAVDVRTTSAGVA